MSERQKSIAEYMSAFGKKDFKEFDVALIESALDNYRRSSRGTRSRRTKAEFRRHNENLSQQLNGRYTPEEIRLYKKCLYLEYEHRTGKPGYGFQGYKERNGYTTTFKEEKVI